MNEQRVDGKTLARECSVFCRYLIGEEPTEYVQRKYREAHGSSTCLDPSNTPDAFLTSVARLGPLSTKVIDAYARVFRPASLVRKKLVLLLAILESCAPSHAYLDSVDSCSIPVLVLKSFQRCASFALAVGLAVLVVLPLELAVRGTVKLGVLWLSRYG